MKLILLGAPGAGKGTQANVISTKLSIPAISTGNIIREALNQGTAMGLEAKAYLDKGLLLPDNVVIQIVKDRISKEDCVNGFILDGFPRTIPQAVALDELGVSIDKVINIEISDEAIMNRMSGRRVCPKCGATYHVSFNPPKTADVCNDCASSLVMRDDDRPETVMARLKVFHSETEPLKDYYEKSGKLRTVYGQDDVSDTTKLTLKALED